MPTPADEVKGSREFYKQLLGLKPGTKDRQVVDHALESLKLNINAGIKIQKTHWPKYYIRKYDVTNLWKLNLTAEARIVYTILGEPGSWVVVVLEVFMGHKEYDKRFGY